MTKLAHKRHSTRLRGYDYSQPGAYFITICTHSRELLFGEIIDGEMLLNAAGQIVMEEWMRTPSVRSEMGIDEFVVMPNHVHGIVVIAENNDFPAVGAHGRAPLHQPTHRKPRSLGSFVAGFKSIVTRRINAQSGTLGKPVWQRNYYEHIIRNENEHNRIRGYILDNPRRWAEDRENPHVETKH
jgi:putative transposase